MRHAGLNTALGLMLGLACVLVVVLGLCGLVVDAVGSPDRTWAFDSETWKANADGSGSNPSNPRWYMREDAQALLTPGLTRQTVLALLGPPDAAHGDELLYCLGFWSGFRMDPDYLHIGFDGAGRLTFTAVIQH